MNWLEAREQYWKEKEKWLDDHDLNIESLDRSYCPICHTCTELNRDFLWERDGFYWYQCSECHLFFVVDPMNQEWTRKYYSQNFFYFYDTDEQREHDRWKFEYIWKQLRKYVPCRTLDWLDLGSGDGFLAKCVPPEVAEIDMVEPNEKGFSTCVKNNDESIWQDWIEDYESGYTDYDLISLFDVLEHLHDPKETLQKIHSWLQKEGLVVILTPNAHSMSSRTLHGDCNMYGAGHIQIFDPINLQILLEQTGFEVLQWETMINDLEGLKHLCFQDENRKLPYGFAINWFTELGTRRGLGYKILMIARKVE